MRLARSIQTDRPRGLNAAPLAIRYLLTGAACAIMSNAFLIALSSAGFAYMTAAIAIFLPMVAFGFVLQTLFVFEEPPTAMALLRYGAAMLTAQPMWLGSLFVLCGMLQLSVAVAGPIATVWLFVWNFLSTRWAISRKRRPVARALQNVPGTHR